MDEILIEHPDGTEYKLSMDSTDPLFNPELFNVITEKEIPKKVVGEIETIKTIFLCSCGRLVLNGKKTSFNLMVNDESGAGKDWVTEKTLEIWKGCAVKYSQMKRKKKDEDEIEYIEKESPVAIKRTRISETVFTYWHNPKFEPDWTWDGKVFYCEDISNSVLNCDVFKVMASSGSFATIVIDQIPIDIEIKGKPVIIITTASGNPNPENIRRFSIVNLDTDIDQTKAIMEKQATYAMIGRNLDYDEDITTSLGKLEFVKVKIPFAEKLIKLFPYRSLIMRTFFERFLDYIKASAALFQFQRTSDKEGFLVAEPQDYEIAKDAILKLISNRIMIPITRNQRKLVEVMKKLGEGFHKIKDIEGKVSFFNKNNLYENLDVLAEKGILKKDKIIMVENEKEKEYIAYAFEDVFGKFSLPTYDEIDGFEGFSTNSPSLSQIPVSQLSFFEKDNKNNDNNNRIKDNWDNDLEDMEKDGKINDFIGDD